MCDSPRLPFEHHDRARVLEPKDLDELRAAVAIAVQQLDRGEGTPWDPDEIKSDGRKILAARTV